MLKFRFPAITPLRLVCVAIGVSLSTPVVWGIWWVSFSKDMPTILQGWFPRFLWELWPLVLFPAGFAAATYVMFKHGMMKPGEEPIESDPHAKLSTDEYWEAVERGRIKPPMS
jgi:hypothetical protein